MANYSFTFKDDELSHHGIEGQKWGVRNGPPYPLDSGDHSKAELRAMRRNQKKTYKNTKAVYYKKGNPGIIHGKNKNLSSTVRNKMDEHGLEIKNLQESLNGPEKFLDRFRETNEYKRILEKQVDDILSINGNTDYFKNLLLLVQLDDSIDDKEMTTKIRDYIRGAFDSKIAGDSLIQDFFDSNPESQYAKEYKALLDKSGNAYSQITKLSHDIAKEALGKYADKPVYAKVKIPGDYNGKGYAGTAEEILARAIDQLISFEDIYKQ